MFLIRKTGQYVLAVKHIDLQGLIIVGYVAGVLEGWIIIAHGKFTKSFKYDKIVHIICFKQNINAVFFIAFIEQKFNFNKLIF